MLTIIRKNDKNKLTDKMKSHICIAIIIRAVELEKTYYEFNSSLNINFHKFDKGEVMQIKRRIYLVCSLGIILIMLTGCMSKESAAIKNKEFTIGVVTKAKDSEYWMSYISGINNAAQDYNVNAVLISPQTEKEGDVQKKMITDMLGKDIEAIAISPIDSNETSYLEMASKRGIPVFATDSDYFDADVPYIGYDNYRMGADLAANAIQYLNGQGSVGIISGSLSQAGHKQRVDGFCDYLSKNSAINTAFIIDGYSNLMLPETEIRSLLDNNPEVGVIFVTNAVAALGLADYLYEQKIDIAICAMDAQQDAYEAVRTGRILALANHSGYDNGYQTVKRIVKTVRDQEEAEDTMLRADILTKDNIYNYDLQGEP